ncbi:hypothetical protein [Beggiatoa alba]|uniref:hypothetical protein n=1 Tax=Beggiatoa alba TaxID=1022 RepID=UPI00058E1142|nr:hypothetical protein [Beggiatoa alba]
MGSFFEKRYLYFIDLIKYFLMQEICKRVLLFRAIFRENFGLQASERYAIILTVGVTADSPKQAVETPQLPLEKFRPLVTADSPKQAVETYP